MSSIDSATDTDKLNNKLKQRESRRTSVFSDDRVTPDSTKKSDNKKRGSKF